MFCQAAVLSRRARHVQYIQTIHLHDNESIFEACFVVFSLLHLFFTCALQTAMLENIMTFTTMLSRATNSPKTYNKCGMNIGRKAFAFRVPQDVVFLGVHSWLQYLGKMIQRDLFYFAMEDCKITGP